MTRLLVSLLLTAGLGTAAYAADDQKLMEDANGFFDPIPTMVQAPENNAITREKVELGKMLYFDPRLSSSHLLSCNTCHNLGLAGTDLQPTSVGHGWQRGPRNAPTVLNSVFNIAQFWDGRAADLKAQAVGPMQAAVEMNSTPDEVVAVLNSMPEYKDRFDVVFSGDEDPITLDNVAKAIEAFEVTLVTPASRFDQFLDGNTNALNDKEKHGLSLFMEKGCVSCHSGVNVGGQDYFPFGVVEKPGADILPPDDKGRFAVTHTATDEYVFRAGTLRNIALTAPYFHSGQVWSLRQAVQVMATAQLGTELTEEEVDSMVAFLHTLTGEQPQVDYPILPASTADTPRPVLTIPGQENN
ncbi:cytochrome c peroxidase [Rhodopseudomonas julia]|uniref:Cytochrome c peroxidase n=1 Tax=Rhodopseudomonas julia TaxID=200617 RepID=A0ABU0CAY2_9BRAD|nr:cytochrome-c peroxidase [Rhodopseudomonas julia]MDQ0327081.1 cytochrome c peroxidase [Rhodopseudomonas julia]